MLVGHENLAAPVACRPPSFLVDCNMLVQICFLSEGLATVGLRAQEWSFSGMYAKVVEKVMPFSEEHLASLVVALKQLDVTLGPWILVLKHPKLPCRWNLLLNFDAREVKVDTTLNMHPCTDRDFLSDRVFLNLVPCYCDRIR